MGWYGLSVGIVRLRTKAMEFLFFAEGFTVIYTPYQRKIYLFFRQLSCQVFGLVHFRDHRLPLARSQPLSFPSTFSPLTPAAIVQQIWRPWREQRQKMKDDWCWPVVRIEGSFLSLLYICELSDPCSPLWGKPKWRKPTSVYCTPQPDQEGK
jgi:hypothetical protein